MPKGKPIPQSVREKIYTSYTLGESSREIADRMDLAVVTVRRVIREQRKVYEKERDLMSRSGKIVKKDGNGGKLMALSPEGFEFTHVTKDGRSHKKKVDGHIARVAERQYDAWCQELDDEIAFMDMVERRNEEQQVRAFEDEPAVEQFEEEAPFEREVVAHTAVEPSSSSVYVIWVTGDKPKFYGAFRTLELALARLDELNAVALFLSQPEAFEVEEVSVIE